MTDKFPQILTVSTGTAGAVDDYVVVTVNLPRGDSSGKRGRRMVYEILKIDWYLNPEDLTDNNGSNFAYFSTIARRASGDSSTLANFAADIQDPTVFGAVLSNNTTTTSGALSEVMPISLDLTDEAGNGILVATDRMFMTGGNVSGSLPGSYTAKVWYRNVSVPGLEFVGIVQSQISGTSSV